LYKTLLNKFPFKFSLEKIQTAAIDSYCKDLSLQYREEYTEENVEILVYAYVYITCKAGHYGKAYIVALDPLK